MPHVRGGAASISVAVAGARTHPHRHVSASTTWRELRCNNLSVHLAKRLFVVAPCGFYRRGEATGGRVPIIVLAWLVGLTSGGFALGWLWELAWPTSDGMAPLTGLIAGCLALVAWAIYVLIVVAVLRMRQRPIEDFLGEDWSQRQRRWWDH